MQLAGQKRELTGKKNKSLRAERLLPAVIFGKGLKSTPITVKFNDFVKAYKSEGETSVIDLVVENKKHPVLIKDVQWHHITSDPIHVGFYEVNLKEKIKAQIPVEVINEKENSLIKSGEALVLLLLDEIEVEALPTDLPDHFEIDATRFQSIDDEITVADLGYDKDKVHIVGMDPEEVIAKLDYAQMIEEEEEVVEEAEAIAGIEATEEKKEEEEEEDKEGKDED